MAEIKYMDIAEFRSIGFLQEANRLFFHPHGLGLAVELGEDGTERLFGIWDYREDPEGIIFANNGPSAVGEESAVRATAVALERTRHFKYRAELFGTELPDRPPESLGAVPAPADVQPLGCAYPLTDHPPVAEAAEQA